MHIGNNAGFNTYEKQFRFQYIRETMQASMHTLLMLGSQAASVRESQTGRGRQQGSEREVGMGIQEESGWRTGAHACVHACIHGHMRSHAHARMRV